MSAVGPVHAAGAPGLGRKLWEVERGEECLFDWDMG